MQKKTRRGMRGAWKKSSVQGCKETVALKYYDRTQREGAPIFVLPHFFFIRNSNLYETCSLLNIMLCSIIQYNVKRNI